MQEYLTCRNVSIVIVLVLLFSNFFLLFNPGFEMGGRDKVEIFSDYSAYLDEDIRYTEVKGKSMEPTFETGDVLLWVQIDNKAFLNSGEIIIYKRSDKLYAHRIVQKVQKRGGVFQIITKGDSQKTNERVSGGEGLGIVIGDFDYDNK